MTQHTGTIIAIIVIAGLLGGLTNFLLILKPEHTALENKINFFKTILLSVCASATVPLFLQIISNNLLDKSPDSPFPDKHYFILSGFCVLAAIYSKRFLEDLYTRVNQVEQKAEEAKQQVAQLENKNQEIDDVNSFVDEKILPKTTMGNYNDTDIKSVINAFQNSKYSWRTATGIAKDTGFSINQVNEILVLLYNAGFADNKVRNDKKMWKVDLS